MSFDYFWLICGLWAGIGEAIFGKFKAKDRISSGEFELSEVNGFLKGYAISIMTPSFMFWLIQMSASSSIGLDFLL